MRNKREEVASFVSHMSQGQRQSLSWILCSWSI